MSQDIPVTTDPTESCYEASDGMGGRLTKQEEQEEEEHVVDEGTEKKKKKKKKSASAISKKPRERVSKQRPEGRPYRRTETDVMHQKIARMVQQKKVLESKMVLLQERLTKHEAEMTARESDEAMDQEPVYEPDPKPEQAAETL